jgi:hypothetical protein
MTAKKKYIYRDIHYTIVIIMNNPDDFSLHAECSKLSIDLHSTSNSKLLEDAISAIEQRMSKAIDRCLDTNEEDSIELLIHKLGFKFI